MSKQNYKGYSSLKQKTCVPKEVCWAWQPDLRTPAAVSPKAPPVIVAELPKQRTADVVQDLQEPFVEDLEMTR